MRIAYIAPYQGARLLQQRPCVRNLSLAARVKIQLVAELLRRSGHEIEIISPGGVDPPAAADAFKWRHYPAFSEDERFHADIPVHYVSAISTRFLIGFWESRWTRCCLAACHATKPFDLVLIYNLCRGQIGCAQMADLEMGVPVVLEYEDDSFVDVHGRAGAGLLARYNRALCARTLRMLSGATGVSPYLLAQAPADVPKRLLRGVVSTEILSHGAGEPVPKKNWVVFSGTHEGTQGLEQMIEAWRIADLPEWELHIAGAGPLTPRLQTLAAGARNIFFHGLLNRKENAQLVCQARIGMNPQDVTRVPGNVFAFKIVEYLAAGAHVLTTPRGSLEKDLEAGVTYIPDNSPATIATALQQVIANGRYARTAVAPAIEAYGPAAVSKSLDTLLEEAAAMWRRRPRAYPAAVQTRLVE